MVFTGTIPVSDIGHTIKHKIAKTSIPSKIAIARMARTAIYVRCVSGPLSMAGGQVF